MARIPVFQTRYVLVFSFLSSIITACSTLGSEDLRLDKRTAEQFLSVLSRRVSLAEAKDMASMKAPHITKNDIERINVEPIIDGDGDTLMYFVNYQEGWSILSADKRTPYLIASSDYGNISLSTDNPGLLSWLDMVALDMKKIIHSPDSSLNFTPERINANIEQWNQFKNKKEPLRPPPSDPPILDGEWELVATVTEEVVCDSLNHLMASQWDQWEPYNVYCPLQEVGSGHCPAGCSPVAGAQMLAFLYSRFGVPTYFVYNGTGANMSDLSMIYNTGPGLLKTAMLIRMIGDELCAQYNDSTTSVLLSLTRLKSYYSSLGYSCTKQSYSAYKVKENLCAGLPILVSGYSGTVLGIPDYSNGHTYIIDGYKRFREKYTRYYERIIGNPPQWQRKTEVSYSSPYIGAIKMNWGWASQWVLNRNDNWFALTGDWIVQVNGSFQDFTEDISILCDFDYDD